MDNKLALKVNKFIHEQCIDGTPHDIGWNVVKLIEAETQVKLFCQHAINCSVVHCKKAPYDVYIGRPSKWGNPFTHRQDGKTLAKHIVGSRDEAVEAYHEWITDGEGKHLMNDLHELKNKVLGCWCKPLSCHGNVLADLVSKHCV